MRRQLTVAINGSRPTGNHHPRCRRESICIAWFRASHPDGAAIHSTQGNPTGATGPHATAACPPLEATRPTDEGDDGFTSAGTLSTGGFRRLDATSALSAPQSRPAIRPLAAKRSSATISISTASRVDAARSRKRRACLLSWGQRTRGTSISLVPDSPARRRDNVPHCRGRVECKSNAGNGLGDWPAGRRWGFSRPRS
jgi:hypothetical protein